MVLFGDCGHALMMALHIDVRGDFPPLSRDDINYSPRPFSYYRDHDMKRRSVQVLQKPSRKVCHDWIFSSSTNTHIAIDKPLFKTYTSFDSYVLSLADHRKIEVKGIGSVELKIRCRQDSRNERTIVLENVLHVPSWLCNIFSDVYFMPLRAFEHLWTESGVKFMVREDDRLQHWGYTENFCGLDRLVLGRRHDGRSPMLDDRDREVYAVNVVWPRGQQGEWEMYAAAHLKKEVKNCETITSRVQIRESISMLGNLSKQSSRSQLKEINANTTPTRKNRDVKISSLKAAASSLSLVRAATLR